MPGTYIFAGSVHLRLGGLADNEGNWEQAKHHYQAVNKMGRELTDLDPENASGWRTRGVATVRLGVSAAHKAIRNRHNATIMIVLKPIVSHCFRNRKSRRLCLACRRAYLRGHFGNDQSQFRAGTPPLSVGDSGFPSSHAHGTNNGVRPLLFRSTQRAYIKLGDAEVALENIQEAQAIIS